MNNSGISPRLLLFLAVFVSGFSGLTNQVIWQRALKLALGGAESLSSMIVVLVFMAGLGIGSLIAGHHTLRGARPFRCFAGVECALATLNCFVWFLLIFHLDSYFVAAQSFALSLGLPLKAVRALLSVVLLALPCCLMGMTTPYAAAALQVLIDRDSAQRSLPLLFFFNTMGGLLGAVATDWFFLPYTGQRFGLVVAIACNLGAALLAWSIQSWGSNPHERFSATMLAMSGPLSKPEVAAFLTGGVALGYEMMLFRIVSLTYQPLPHNFSLVLCLFLFTWSGGVWLSSRVDVGIQPTLHIIAGLLCLVPVYITLDRFHLGVGFWPWILVYFIPVVFFGLLYGQLVKEVSSNWGRDVGRFYFLNTLGSCLGICGMTLIGFEYSLDWDCFALAALVMLTSFLFRFRLDLVPSALFQVVLVLAVVVVVQRFEPRNRAAVFYGGDGVVEVLGDNVFLDGLWHSKLARGEYIASNNWHMALAPMLAHSSPEDVTDVLVVGFGTGITAHVFTGHPNIKTIDAYETNRTLRKVLSEFAQDTMHVADHPRINLFWQDGRSGLELREKKYDIVTSAPLYLKQAGSASLLSSEYMEKVKSRLKPGGVIAVYSNGDEAQALLVRKTLAKVFPYTASIKKGYLLLGSTEPMSLTPQRVGEFAAKEWAIAKELRLFNGEQGRFSNIIDTDIEWSDRTPYYISDNHPLVEYPKAARALLGL